MNTKGKIIIALGAAVAAYGAAYGVAYLRSRKASKEAEAQAEADAAILVAEQAANSSASSAYSSSASSAMSANASFPLRWGSRGQQVAQVQTFCRNSRGEGLAVDGIWGKDTEAAVANLKADERFAPYISAVQAAADPRSMLQISTSSDLAAITGGTSTSTTSLTSAVQTYASTRNYGKYAMLNLLSGGLLGMFMKYKK